MTVAELIKTLQTMPQDAAVLIPVYEYGHLSEREVERVAVDSDGDVIIDAG